MPLAKGCIFSCGAKDESLYMDGKQSNRPRQSGQEVRLMGDMDIKRKVITRYS